jgi:hypothetical protein
MEDSLLYTGGVSAPTLPAARSRNAALCVANGRTQTSGQYDGHNNMTVTAQCLAILLFNPEC